MLLFYFITSIIIIAAIQFSGKRIFIYLLMGLFSVLQIGISVYSIINLNQPDLVYFTYDPLAVIFLTVLTILSVVTIYHSFIYLNHCKLLKMKNYMFWLTALVTSISGAYLTNNMTVTWIFIEATTIISAFLIFHERSNESLEATWKYVFVCSVGIALAYFGILFLSFSISDQKDFNLSYENIQQLVTHAKPLYLKLAFLFVFVGYSTKMGLFPMHTVAIDAHTVAPAPVNALLSTALKNLGFLAIFRIFTAFSQTEILSWMQHILLLGGIISLLVAAGYMLKAKHNMRMLAYSSMENMGLAAIAVGIGGIGYYAAILHLILHSFLKAGLFLQMGQAYRLFKTHLLDECGNYMKLNPYGTFALFAGLIGITAIPPSGLFISEFFIFKQLVLNGNWFVFITAGLLLTVVIYAVSVRFLHIIFSPPRSGKIYEPLHKNIFLENFMQYALIIVVFVLCIYRPDFLNNIINLAIENLPK